MSGVLCPLCGQRSSYTGHVCWVEHPHHTWTSDGKSSISSTTIVTDNTAVIRALEKRVEELEAVAEAAERYLTVASGEQYTLLLNALYAAGYLK